MQWWERHLPKFVLAPSLLVTLFFVYGFLAFTVFLSLTSSTLMPSWDLAGFSQYTRLWSNLRWQTAFGNLFLFGGLFISACLILGLLLAILLDQKIRAEGWFRTIYLYPMALSFIVTGIAWKWILDPTLGIGKVLGVKFDWLVNPDRAIYALVLAAVWQSSGFVMALFLAGLRSVDADLVKAAVLDGASMPTIYRRIIIPSLRPVFVSAVVILFHIAIKTFDLVIAMTGGGPGYASDLPATFMYSHAFQRSQMGLGAASAVIILLTVVGFMVPYLWSEMRRERRAA